MAIVLAEVSGKSRWSMSVNELISRTVATQVVSGAMIYELS